AGGRGSRHDLARVAAGDHHVRARDDRDRADADSDVGDPRERLGLRHVVRAGLRAAPLAVEEIARAIAAEPPPDRRRAERRAGRRRGDAEPEDRDPGLAPHGPTLDRPRDDRREIELVDLNYEVLLL